MTLFCDMTRLSPVLRCIGPGQGLLFFWCPGCDRPHQVSVSPNVYAWGYNDNPDKPTFTPSIKTTRDHVGECCHSYVTDGRIQFLNDCTHALAGQTVDLPEWPSEDDIDEPS